MQTWMKISLAVAALAVLAGCSSKTGEPTALTVKAENSTFGTKEINLEKGKTYKLVFDNKDVQLHDFSIDKIEGKIEHAAEHGHDMGHDMGGKNPDLHIAAEAGKSGTITFTPTRAGTYTFYCTVEGHKDMGMSGKLIVK